ncbi:MAG: hypothetical protein NTX91_04540 [candidate division SR1 bacterium]|nr:hypothetical protein [candidate division SR1 bacterium]
MLKFFLRGYLKHHNISLEEIMGYMALGCMISYFVAGSLAYYFRKKHLITISTIIAIVVLSIGQRLGYYPFEIFVIIVGVIGMIFGLRTVIKSILLSSEIQKSEFGETSINGVVNIAILGGTILGCYLGFVIYGAFGGQGFWILIANLIAIILASAFLGYDVGFQKKSIKETLRIAIPSITGVIKKYFWLLVPIGALWAISTAVGQKMLEIGIDVFNKVPKSSILIIVISIVGAIFGHIISAFFTKHKRYLSMIFTIILGLTTFYFPYILNRYDYYITLNISSFFMGVFFGIAVNLLEGRFFYHIGEDHRKEYGSAAYGIATNIVIFFVMIVSDFLTNKIGVIVPFIFFGIVLLIMPLFIRRFK